MKNFSTQQITSLQGLRAIGFLMVLFGHCSVKGTGNLSAVAVSLFFVLSGFVLDYSHGNKDLPYDVKSSICFAWNRIKKLYILHLILLVAMLVLEIFEMDGFHHNFKTIIINALLLHAWFPDTVILNSFNGITWYLSASVLLYFLFPILEKGIRKYKNLYQAVGGLFIVVLVRIIWSKLGFLYLDDSVIGWFQYFFPLTRLWEFIIGCHLGYIYRHHKWTGNSFTFVSVLEIFSVSFLIISWQMMKNVVGWSKYIIVIPGIILLVYLLAQSKGVISEFLSKKNMVKLGNISGYTYITHYVVLRYIYIILYRFGMENMSPLLVAAVTFILTIISTHIYLYIMRKTCMREYAR